MLRTIVTFLAVTACASLLGCSKGPSEKVVKRLARGYLVSVVPGISEKEITILKSSEKDGNTMVSVQAGGMQCDMTVFKEKKNWRVKDLSCNGQFEPADKAAERRRSYMLATMKQAVEELNKKVPIMSADGTTRTDKYEIVNNSMVVYQTNVTASTGDMTAKEIEDKKANYLPMACVKLKEVVSSGINYEYIINDKDGKPLMKHQVNNETCSEYLRLQNVVK
jgi:hypothetical protein